MARITGYVTQHPEAYEYYIDWEEYNVNQQANTSSVRATVYIHCISHSSWANNKTTNLWINGVKFSNTLNISLSPGAVVALVSGNVDNIGHAWDGSCSIGISASGDLPSGSGYGPLWGEASQTIWLTQIPRQANFSSVQIQNTNIEHFDVYYNMDKTLSAMQYRLNGGTWQNITPYWGDWNKECTFTISNLSPNTNYTVQLKATCNGIDTYSSVYSTRTLDIARFTNLSDFIFGDLINISKNNESNNTNYLTVKVNDSIIINRRYLGNNNFTVEFTQDELDNLYKALKSFNQAVEFILITNYNGQDWTSSIVVNCIFKGNQKTANYYIADQTRKRAKLLYYTEDKVSKKAILIIKKEGIWRRCI